MTFNRTLPAKKSGCERFVRAQIPPRILVAIINAISVAYTEAFSYSQGFSNEIQGYQFGQSLWGQIYEQLLGVVKRHNTDVDVRVLRTEGNHFPYIELRCGLILMRVWRTNHIHTIIEKEEFEDYLQASDQGELFTKSYDFGGLQPVHAAITHGPSIRPRIQSKPGHLALGFPNESFYKYDYQFDMFTLSNQNQPRVRVKKPSELDIELKPKKKGNK